MKKFFFLFAMLGLFAFTADAQCSKAKGTSNAACCAKNKAAAAKAAKLDDSIVRQVSNDGEVTYTRKNVAAESGKVSFTNVEYCSKSGKFVNVSPADKKAACTKNGRASKVSSTSKKACSKGGKKACCAKGAKKASCHKGEKASTETSQAGDAKVKLVKGENN